MSISIGQRNVRRRANYAYMHRGKCPRCSAKANCFGLKEDKRTLSWQCPSCGHWFTSVEDSTTSDLGKPQPLKKWNRKNQKKRK